MGNIAYEPPKVNGVLVVIHYPEDITFTCPACDEQASWPRRRTGFRCSKCKEPLIGFELGNALDGTPDWKPPKGAAGKPQLLGGLLPECPRSLETFPYKRADVKSLLRLAGQDSEILFEAISYQAQQYLSGRRKRIDVVSNGLVAALQRHEVITGETKEEEHNQGTAELPAALAQILKRNRADPAPNQSAETGGVSKK